MTPVLVYFLKINLALMLFYAFYRLLFYKDTFFTMRRVILITFFGLSLLYPLMNFQDWVKQQEPIAEVILIYSDMLPSPSYSVDDIETMSWRENLKMMLVGIYWTGILLLSLRFLIQLISIIRLRVKSIPQHINGVKIYTLDRVAGPFSFFKWIFMHPESHRTEETDEILTHELSHARQWHSIDVIISELFCMGCWMNPFAWLLKREVRHNLEYLADNTVLKSGYDCRSYQYHLLGLAHHESTANLYNSFNVMHLKNRISMMNKKRTHSLGRAKYLMFLPLSFGLMLISNMEAVARITTEITHNVMAAVETVTDANKEYSSVEEIILNEPAESPAGTAIPVKENVPGTISDRTGDFQIQAPDNSYLPVAHPSMAPVEIPVETANREAEKLKTTLNPVTSGEKEEADEIFTVVEDAPAFPGGEVEMLKYVNRTVKYPVLAQEYGIQGRVVCSFVVTPQGDIRDVEVVRGIDPSLDMEAIRVIQGMPAWKPGKQRGKAVAVRFTLPIQFRLQ